MGFRRSRRLWVAGEVEGSWVEGSRSKIGGSKALGSSGKSKICSWVRGAKSLGHGRSRSSWVAGDGLSLSLSLSLSLYFPKNDI